jgi:glucose/arabinose dehydrogenase
VGSSSAQLPSITTGVVSVEVQAVATGLTSPVDLVSAQDGTGRLFIVEQPGRIKVLANGTVAPAAFLDVTTQIVNGGERGLLGLAFHPGFANPSSPGFRRFYTYTTEPPTGPVDFTVAASSFDNRSVVAEWQASSTNPNVADPSTRRDVLRINHPQSNHNGGKIAFRPSDGYLYIATGDGGSANDVGNGHTPNLGNGQDTANVLGKILRIDPLAPSLTPASADAASANGRYRVPATNPFFGAPGADEIYAYGFRNPYRFSFEPVADRLIAADVGQAAIEEVDIVERGRNYGWNRKEGSFLFNPANGSVSPDPNPDPALVDPVLEYDHGDGISVIGGFVYRGSAVPALAGKYVFGEFRSPATASGRLFYSDLASGVIEELRLGVNPRILGSLIKGFGQDANGEIYVLADSGGATGGQALKIVPIAATSALLNLSTRARVEADDNGLLIAGFILTGSAPKNVVVRALGPSLNVNGTPVAGRLSNPLIDLRDAGGDSLGENDDWMNGPRRQDLIDLGLAPPDALESALLVSLQPGAYTAVVRGVRAATGIGLVELYDVEQAAPANAANISSRGNVQTGDNIVIGGFILGSQQRVIVRALGPSLEAQGVAGVLPNPALELVDSAGNTVAANDNWRTDQASEITASGLAPTNDAESAVIRTLVAGSYTAIVRGASGSTGVALVEIYRLNP